MRDVGFPFELYKNSIRYLGTIEVPEVVALLDKVSSDDDKTALALYVFLCADRTDNNPIKNYASSEIPVQASNIVFKTSSVEDSKHSALAEDISKAIRGYKRVFSNKLQTDIDLYDEKLYQFMDLLGETTPQIVKNEHDVSGTVKFTTNVDIITGILEEIIKIILNKAAIVGMQNGGKFIPSLRGGLSPNSKGKLTKIKD